MSIQEIWRKILRGEPLTYAEQTAWSNRWNTEYPSRAV